MAESVDLPAWLDVAALQGGQWLLDGSLCHTDLRVDRYRRKGDQARSTNGRDRRTPTERDVDRIQYSAFLRRLGGIAQIISPTLTHSAIHNRLTHSFKVSLVAREIANDLLRTAQNDETVRGVITDLGGLDISACTAAGLAHDIGHAPFAHAAAVRLDTWLREKSGPASLEGFEGNAQSLRVVGDLDLRKQDAEWGLDLTAVTLAAMLKYPYTRDGAPDQQSSPIKFSVYAAQDELLRHARKAMPISYPGDDGVAVVYRESRRQSLECSIVDLADDITYATHDLQDFYETGLLDLPQVIGELETVAGVIGSTGLEGVTASGSRRPLARAAVTLNQTHAGWFHQDTYVRALRSVLSWLTQIRESIAGVDPDSEDAKALIQSRFSSELGQIISSITITRREAWDQGPNVHPESFQWHKVQVMKTISQQYIIGSPAVSMHEQAQLSVLDNLLKSLLKWCESVRGPAQLPVRLRAYITEMGLRDSLSDGPELRRAIVDYLCSLTDDECVDLQARLTGLTTPIISKIY
jgi:dGTPase